MCFSASVGVAGTVQLGTVDVNADVTVDLTGVSATANVGQVVIPVPVSGFQLTGSVGTAIVAVNAIADLVGVQAVGIVSGNTLIWSQIDDNQNPNWTGVNDSQTPGWSDIIDTQSPNWTDILEAA